MVESNPTYYWRRCTPEEYTKKQLLKMTQKKIRADLRAGKELPFAHLGAKRRKFEIK